MRFRKVSVFLISLLFMLLSSNAYSERFSHANEEKLNEIMHSSKNSLNLQTEIPAKPVSEPDNFSENKVRQEKQIPELAEKTGGLLSSVFFWMSLAAIAGILFYVLKNSLWSSSLSKTVNIGNDSEWVEEKAVSRMAKAQMGADAAALSGDYSEAMHILLLQSLEELRYKLSLNIAESLTSREILKRVDISEEGRNAFADIIGKVEISYFGFHEAAKIDYEECRKSYDVLAGVINKGSSNER